MRKEEIGNCELYLGDCLDILPSLDVVDAVITDPPYSSGGFQEAGRAGGSIGTPTKATIPRDNLSTRGYTRLMRRVLDIPAAECYVFTDWRMWCTLFDVLEDTGYLVRSMLVWAKNYPALGCQWRAQHELIAYGVKQRLGHDKYKSEGNVLSIPRLPPNRKQHPTQKPVELIQTLLQTSDKADTVLDPFMGSGTTGVVCVNLGRKFIGIEINEAYFETACRRIEACYKEKQGGFK